MQQRNIGELDDAAAADVAAYVTAVRGQGASGTTAAECRSLSPAFLADVWQVGADRSRSHMLLERLVLVWPCRATPAPHQDAAIDI